MRPDLETVLKDMIRTREEQAWQQWLTGRYTQPPRFALPANVLDVRTFL